MGDIGKPHAAYPASRQKSSYLRALFYRRGVRREKQRAAVVVGRSILQMVYHMIQRGEKYHELGADYQDQLVQERTAKSLVKQLEVLNYMVNVRHLIAVETGNKELVEPDLLLSALVIFIPGNTLLHFLPNIWLTLLYVTIIVII
jgi:hypothetical protein